MYPQISQEDLDQNLTLRDYLDILYKRRLTVLTVFLIVFVVSLIMVMGKETPLYTSTSTILLERNFGANNAGLGTYYYWDPEFLPTQTEIIKSKNVALRVVENLQLDAKYHTHFLNPDEEDISFTSSLKSSMLNFFSGLIGSRKADDESDKVAATDPDFDKRIIAEIIRRNISVSPVKDTRVVNIQYTDKNPQVAKMITDALVQAYIEETLEIKLSGTKQSLKWMTNKAELERKKLEDAERKIQQYMRKHNLVTLENRLAIYPEKLSQFSTDLSSAEAKRKELEDLHEQIADAKNSPEILETIPLFAENANLQSLKEQILKAEQKIKELSQKYGPKHPAMIKAVQDRDILLQEKELEIQRIEESTQKAYELARSKEENLRELLNSTKEELMDVNEKFIQYSIMKREVDSSRALYEALTSSLKKASVTEESQNVNIWVMREASLPSSPSNQRPQKSVLIGLVLALAAGVGVTLLIEYMDNTIKSSEDVENKYGLTVLGSVLETKKNQDIENIVLEQGQSPIAESYRMIRSSLLLSSADHPPKTILLTSIKAQEGKTSTALNLARTMAQIADRILIIDADMRKPRMHILLDVPNAIGLSSYLSGNIDEKIIHTTGEEKISVIPSGPIPPNPVELISSNRMKNLLSELSKTYDYIIIDSPPVLHLADGLVLSTFVDGTVLVIRAGKTSYDMFSTGLRKLVDFKPHILGVILNSLSSKMLGAQQYYHYYEYYSEDKTGQESK